MYEYCEIGIYLILIFPIPERNADKYIFRAMISKKCLDFPKKISGNQVPMFPTFCMSAYNPDKLAGTNVLRHCPCKNVLISTKIEVVRHTDRDLGILTTAALYAAMEKTGVLGERDQRL